MTDPRYSITNAFYKALTVPPLLLDGVAFPVYSYAPSGVKEYVLLSQITAKAAAGSAGCEEWSCTILVSVFTHFSEPKYVNELPAYKISEQIGERLAGQRLDLDGFTMSPIELQLANSLPSFDQQDFYVNHYLRYQFSVYK